VTPQIVSWKVARNFTPKWHLLEPAGASTALCGAVIPGSAPRSILGEHSAGLMLDQLCKPCLVAYTKDDA
jgi:hypothetical protein